METAWTRDPSTKTLTYYKGDQHGQTYGYATEYGDISGCCWQAIRGDYRLSGFANTMEEAQALADKHLDLPQEDFDALVAERLIEDLRTIEKKLLTLCPSTRILSGYHVGFEAGFDKARQAINAALEAA